MRSGPPDIYYFAGTRKIYVFSGGMACKRETPTNEAPVAVARDSTLMHIDAHQHFWRVARGDYGWLTKTGHPKIARDFLPDDLSPLLAAAKIEKTILVQAAPTAAETEFLLGLAAPFVAGVVGWVDFDAPDAAASIARFAANPKLLGLRPMLQDMRDDEWMLRPELAPAFDAMQRGDLRFDALVKPRHLPALGEFLERYPNLPVVIDHGAKPNIAGHGLELWASYIRHIAKNSNACCKLSGLLSEAGTDWSAQTLKPYVDVLLGAFGPARLMWGSDWPVLNEVSDYPRWLDAAETLTESLSSGERDALFGDTAAKFYGLP